MAGVYETPEIEAGQYLLDIWRDLGRFGNNGMGLIPISFQDIQSYSQMMADDLEPWEVRTILDCSQAFLWGLRLGENPLAFTPMQIASGE